MRLSRAAVSLYALLIFASGVAVGGFGFRLYTVKTVNASTSHDPVEWRKRYTAEMRERLHLDSDQQRKLNEILDETKARFDQVRARNRPEMDRIHAEQVEKIRSMLTDSQRPEYDKMRREKDEREKRPHL
jgi:DNA anti-recombination protein RmuC